MKSSYSEDDVKLLLKDITGLVEPISTAEREKLIQSGVSYCEMLPIESKPSDEYIRIYNEVLDVFAKPTADAVARLSDKIVKSRGTDVVLVSLARAGIPVGVLVKRYIKFKYNLDVPHYAISIIRGKGIDDNAMRYILDHHSAESILFLDGWTGKGAINKQLNEAVSKYKGVSSELAVVADPANITDLCGTHEDILIPNSCLNSTVSGLISRTFCRSDIIKENDFHGAVYYSDLESEDLSYSFVDRIEREFTKDIDKEESSNSSITGLDEVKNLAEIYGIDDINLIKPSIGETTRVLLRRIPWKVLINNKYKDDIGLKHIVRLAQEKGVSIEYTDLVHYKACGVIKKLADI